MIAGTLARTEEICIYVNAIPSWMVGIKKKMVDIRWDGRYDHFLLRDLETRGCGGDGRLAPRPWTGT